MSRAPLECLEPRCLLSTIMHVRLRGADSFHLLDPGIGGVALGSVGVGSTGICTIGGSSGADAIVIRYDDAADAFTIDINGGLQSVSAKAVHRFRISAGDGDDTISFVLPAKDKFRSLANTIYGEGGNDLIIGSAGSDRVYGGEGHDTISTGGGVDRIYGDGGNDVVSAGSSNDYVWAGDGDDTVNGLAGRDRIDGEAGRDFLCGSSGNDRVMGGAEDDTVSGGSGNDSCQGDGGNDVVAGNAGNDEVAGGNGNDMVAGGDGEDRCFGGSGHDDCEGGGGNDLVDGGESVDTVMGGPGEDAFHVESVDASDAESQNDQSGAVFSGAYSSSLGKLAVLISNEDDAAHKTTLPSTIGGYALSTTNWTLPPGSHLLLEYTLANEADGKWQRAG